MTLGRTASQRTLSLVAIAGSLLLLSSLMLLGTTEAQVISWNYDATGTVGGDGAGDHSDPNNKAGAVLAGNWTNSFPSNLTQDLQDDTGAITTLDIGFSSYNTFQIQGTHPGQDSDNSWNKEMLNGYLNAGPATWNPPITYSEVVLDQIPYSSFDVYVYFSSDVAGREGDVTDLTTTYSFNTLGPASIAGANGILTQTTDTVGTYATAANYAVFSGLSGASQTVRVQMRDNDEWGGIAGFQLVNTGSVVLNWNTNLDNQLYSDPNNWLGGVAPSANDYIRFGDLITGNRNVVIDDPNVSLNSIRLDNAGDGDYYLVPNTSETITLTGGAEVSTTGRHWLQLPVAGSAGLTKTGSGELILDASNSFSGGLTVSTGKLSVLNTGAIPSGNNVEVAAGAELLLSGGAFFVDNGMVSSGYIGGTINGTISGAGQISVAGDADPNSPNSGADATFTGDNTFAGNIFVETDSKLTLNSGGKLRFDVNNDNDNNFINGGGTLDLNGKLKVDVTDVSDVAGAWDLIDVNTLSENYNSNFGVEFDGGASFSESSGIWSGGGYVYNESTGYLSKGDAWIVDADGDMSTAANWNSGVAPSAGANLVFTAVITENRTVTLDSSLSVNSVTFDNAFDGDYFVVDDPNNPGNSLTLLSGATIKVQGGRHWMRADLAGTNGVNIIGGGEFILDADNSFSGGLDIDDTDVAVTHAGAIPSGNSISILNAGSLKFWGSNNGFFFDNGTGLDPNTTETVNGVVTIGNTSVMEVNGGSHVSFTNQILNNNQLSVNDSTASFGGGILNEGQMTLNNSTTTVTSNVENNGAIVVSNGGTASFTSTISGSGSLTTSVGATASVSGSTTYSGVTQLWDDSTLNLSGSATLGNDPNFLQTNTNLAHTSQLGLNGVTIPATEYIHIDGGVDGTRAKIASSGSSSIASNINLWNFGGEYVEFSSASGGNLTLSGVIAGDDVAGNDRSVVFSGAGNFNLIGKIIDAEVDSNGDPVSPASNLTDDISVIKRGSGNLTISTATDQQDDYWQVATVIEGGKIIVKSDGAGGGELWSKTINVAGSTAVLDVTDWQDDLGSPDYNLQEGQALGGAGTVNAGTGGVGVFGDNNLTPGASVGTLKVTGNLRFKSGGSGGQLNYELGNTTAIGGSENDLIQVSGAVTTTAAAAYQVNVMPVEYALATGTYRAISHTGGTTNFTASTGQILNPANPDPNNPLTTRQSVSINGSTAGQVNIVVSGTAANQTWTGNTDAIWSKDDGKSNWSGTGTEFFDLDTVTFNASGNNKNVSVSEEVVPASMTVTGNGANYNFSGQGIYAGSVTVSNNAVATFSNTVGGNVSVQNTAILAGTGTHQNNVSVASGGTLRVGGATMPSSANDGVISWNVDNNGTIGGDGAGSDPNLSAEAGVMQVGGWTNDWPVYDYTDLRDDSGNASTLDISPFSNSGTWNINGFAHKGQDADGSWNQELLTGYLNSGAPNGTGGAGVVISEIPYTAYDIIVYFNSDNNTRTGTVSDGTSTYSFKAAGAAGSFGGDGNAIFSEATALTTTADTANYAVFSGLTGSTQTITVDIPDFGGLAGFQVVGDPNTQGAIGETMFVQGNVSFVSGSTISLNIGQNGFNDLLDIGGAFSVTDGVVLEVLLDSSVSAGSLLAGDSWDLFDFDPNNVIGSWDPNDFTLPSGLASGLEWDVSNLLTTGVLSVATSFLPGDFNMDGRVDALDFLFWQRNPGAGKLADWSANYGLPATSNATAVPEPSTIVLLLAGLSGLTRRRQSKS